MRRQIVCFLVILGFVAGAATADDLHGARTFLCAPLEATQCSPEGGCETGSPWKWDIPRFIMVDLEAKMLTTTKASGVDRTTPIRTLERAEDKIFIQGIELGRAYSFVLDEGTGIASFAVAMPELTVTAFGSCTPAVAVAP